METNLPKTEYFATIKLYTDKKVEIECCQCDVPFKDGDNVHAYYHSHDTPEIFTHEGKCQEKLLNQRVEFKKFKEQSYKEFDIQELGPTL